MAANEIIIPVSLTFLSLDGCAQIVETINSIKEKYAKKDLDIKLIVPTLYRNTRLANAILEKLHGYFKEKVSRTSIGYNVKIDEAQSLGKTIFEYAPKSKGAIYFAKLASEIERL
jgi:chromosome partitioning protein